MNLDTRVFYEINDFARHTPWLHPIMSWFADDGVLVLVVLMAIGWWMARRTAQGALMAAAIWTPLGVIAALLVYDPIALAANETRPCRELPGIIVLHCNVDGGFPSVHAVIAGAVAAGLWLVDRRLGVVTVVAAAAVAFARVYVAAHYPQDVLAGLALGALVSVLGYALARPLLQRLVAFLVSTPLRTAFTTAR